MVLFASFLELGIWYFHILLMPNYCFVSMAVAFHGFLSLVIVRDLKILQDERINIMHINIIFIVQTQVFQPHHGLILC